MVKRIVVGVFPDADAAERARRELIHAGFTEARIVASAPLTGDDIAAEAPGQSFENQPGQPPEDSAAARCAGAVRTGACILNVEIDSITEGVSIEQLMRRSGARHTAERPAR
jgi:hypothetical protein